MAKKDLPKIDRDFEQHETRPFHVKREGLEAPSSRIIYFDCPFCDVEVRAYVWSISGGGKRCACGAYHGSRGKSYHWKDQARRQRCGAKH